MSPRKLSDDPLPTYLPIHVVLCPPPPLALPPYELSVVILYLSPSTSLVPSLLSVDPLSPAPYLSTDTHLLA